MYKKIILIIMVFVIIGSTAFANDAGLQPGKHITYKIIPKSYEVELGGTFEFTLRVTNHTQFSSRLMYFEQFFSGEMDSYEDYSHAELDIPPYRTVEFDCHYQVPFNIQWYQIRDKYYVDIDPILVFYNSSSFDNTEYREEDAFYRKFGWGYDLVQSSSNAPRLEITNLYDGSAYMDIDAQYGDGIVYIQNDDSWMPQYNLFPKKNSTASITNKSDMECKILSHNSELALTDDKEDTPIYLQPGETFDIPYYGDAPYLLKRNFRNTVMERNTAIFELDGKYYGVISQKKQKTEAISIYYLQIIEDKYVENKEDYTALYTVTVKNTSGKDLNNFIFYYPIRYDNYDYPDYEDIEDDIVPVFKKNSEITYEYEGKPKWYGENDIVPYNFGFQINNCIYLFDVYTGYYSDRIECNCVSVFHLSTPEPEPTPVPTPTPAPAMDAYGTEPTPAPTMDAYGTEPTSAPTMDAYGTEPTPAPTMDAYGTEPTPAPTMDAYSTEPTPAPTMDAYGTVELTPAPTIDPYGTAPTPAPTVSGMTELSKSGNATLTIVEVRDLGFTPRWTWLIVLAAAAAAIVLMIMLRKQDVSESTDNK